MLDCVGELLENYDIKGVQFDDYFYPQVTDEEIDSLYESYLKSGGALSLSQWRAQSLSSFIGAVHSLVKSKNQNSVFGVSPRGVVGDSLKFSLADIVSWCETGSIDYCMPQIYYGLENSTAPFEKTLYHWVSIGEKTGVTLYCGLAAYKCASEDKFAGVGSNEWVENSDILSREYEILQKNTAFSGFSLFSYDYCFGEKTVENARREINALGSVLK